ncbi:hypothetical protein [Floridanema evergladense]|uniref:Uncharacterized protein n=1 Tax=Floridaenema evergladense BLCC-F167 TaxID=3153639 RepID=A0ABV4WWA0_9CYAN
MDASIKFNFQSIRYTILKWLKQHQIDSLIAVILAIGFAISSYLSAQRIPDAIITDFYAQDVWFGSDIPTVFGNITSLQSDFGRNNKHPLFPLLIFPLVFGLGKIFHLEPVAAARLVTALFAGAWIAALYALFRLMRCPRLDASIFSLLGGVSSAAVFWFVVPESFPSGSLSLLLPLLLLPLAEIQKVSPVWYGILSGFSVSITITNWMSGLLATFVSFRPKKAIQITLVTFVIVNVLWILQRIVFTNTGYSFAPKTFIGEKKFITTPESDSVLSAISSFFYQTIVMPAIEFKDSPIRPDWVKLATNTLTPGSGGIWGTVAAICWTGLLLIGIWGFFTTKQQPKLRIVLGLIIVGQLLIHSVYGARETFIYSLHFAPLLLILAAFSSLTRLRLVALVLAGVLVVSAGINNRSQYNQATATLQYYGTPQQQVEAQMRLRPGDPWLRNVGHIVLGTPGSRAQDKAYYEPGGSFSPVAGSFGVSIWVLDKNGNLKATSDNIPLDKIKQQFANLPDKQIPGIFTTTEYYQTYWSAPKPGTWDLNLKIPANSQTQPVLVIRSVGPAGGSIKSLNWDGQRLLINNRWSVKLDRAPAKVHLGSETSPNWISQASVVKQWEDKWGWGYARIELAPGDNSIELANFTPAPITLNATKVLSDLVLDLPDRRFVETVNAQIAHLMMGLVGDRTTPSDPINYPLPRFQEGAYQLVALARAGKLDVAKQLSGYFAETDFVDGIQWKANVPALGIWALAEVAEQVNQPEYDRYLWPHIQRKAQLIMNMLTTNRPGYPVVEKSKAPFAEQPDFLETDSIAGKMDNQPDLITIDPSASMISYRALLDAATIADRVGQSAIGKTWRSEAGKLQAAWDESFKFVFATTPETYTTSLWPSGIGASNREVLTQELERRWNESHDANGSLRQPVTPFLNLAETHQWLVLGKSDRVWNNLQWFWQNQTSPGLYTWWGDKNAIGELPKSFSQWHRYRGWINPPNATPHYGSAAQMLLLQLDMLTYVDLSQSQPTLVIGAGIPKTWLKQPINVKGLQIGGSLVNWTWDGKQINVEMKGKKMNVQLGSAFPANTPVNLNPTQKTS